MRQASKLLLPAVIFATPLIAPLTSCTTTSSNNYSVIEETATDLQADTCADLKLPNIDPAEYDAASEYWRKLVREMNAAWQKRCA